MADLDKRSWTAQGTGWLRKKNPFVKKSVEPPSYFLAGKLERQQMWYFWQEKFFSI